MQRSDDMWLTATAPLCELHRCPSASESASRRAGCVCGSRTVLHRLAGTHGGSGGRWEEEGERSAGRVDRRLCVDVCVCVSAVIE